ncbi:MAG: PilN domain-containing protein [Methylococcaceae bacterium]|nr:PilN domain-containing protein [Methylococcaceae bacterium]
MAKINLLPWREELRKKKQKDFLNALVLSILAGFIILGLIHTYIEGLIAYQEQRNQILKNEIALLDKKIVEIKDIEDKKSKLLVKIDLIQKLQESRPEIVHLFDEISKTTPDGVFLTKFTQTGSNLIFEGKSQSNARISAFMRAIEASPWLQTPTLTVIQSPDKQSSKQSSDKTNNEQLSDFTLNAKQGKQNTETENEGTYEPVGN